MIRRRDGSTLILVLVLLGVIGVSAVVVQNSTRQITQVTKEMRVRSLMNSAEERLVQYLLTPRSYQCDSAVGPSSCSLTSQARSELAVVLPVIGALCPSTGLCGIVVKDISFNAATRVMSAKVHYQGRDISIGDRDFSLRIPDEVLQSNAFECPVATPIFEGFTTQGKLKCRGFPKAPLGQFVKGIDSTTMTPVFGSLPTPAGCSTEQFISVLNWSGGSSMQISCAERLVVRDD